MAESKYEQVKQAILQKITEGEWLPGEKIPPQRDLESLFGVSRITIRKAVSDFQSNGVLEHLPGKKGLYITSLHSGSHETKTIAVALDDITNYFDSMVLKGIEESLWAHNYHTIVCNANRNMAKIEDYFSSFDFSKIDGIIYLPVIDHDYLKRNRAVVSLFQEHNVPYVLLDQYLPGIRANYVVSDHRHSAHDLCQALINKGHTKILVGKGLDCTAVKERIGGVRDVYENNGLPFDEKYVLDVNDSLLFPSAHAEPDRDEMLKIQEQIEKMGDFTAVYTVNNRIMKAVILCLLEMGRDVSKIQLALHNTLNKPVPPYTDNIPHVASSLNLMGYEAANLLLKVMREGNKNKYQMVVNSELVLENLA